MQTLNDVLTHFRATAKTEREKGNYFEHLAKLYFENEPRYKDLYSDVWLWEAWRAQCIADGNGDPTFDPGADTGIDLVAKTHGTAEYHAIQAKFYDAESTLYKNQVDSFFTASGKKPFTKRLLILSTDNISTHVDTAMEGQHIPCIKITLADLEQSHIDWAASLANKPTPNSVKFKQPKNLRDYQNTAISNVIAGLQTAHRGKLIMACGTGKTFTALRMAERIAGAGKRVLFLVPSLSLLSQTLTEWTQETATPMHCFAVCSDSEVGKKRIADGDDYQMLAHELQFPATTNPKALAHEIAKRHDATHMSVVFSTYHSIDVISQAQLQHKLAEFDLIICDEAHRTTGASFDGDDESAFVKVHNQAVIAGVKRVYMTATPRIYGVPAKVKAETEKNVALYSMDSPEHFGETLHTLSFSEAVHGLGILCDYKVIVLTVSEDHISANLQGLLADENNNLRVDDAAKIVGCWRALSKLDTQEDLSHDPEPMQRAVAFCQVIEINKGAKTRKVSSKNIAGMFQAVVNEYRAQMLKDNPDHPDAVSKLQCEAQHVDGGMNAAQKEIKLNWLKAEIPANTCRVLSNVRCLSEGVDVPALDAVLFLTPRNSVIDVVQSVGRVMRKPANSGKKLGYVILPVVIPAGMEADEALNDNKTYKVVWEVLQALRSHDDRFDAMINKLDLTGQDKSRMEVIAVTDNISLKSKAAAVNNPQAKALKASQKGKAVGRDSQPSVSKDANAKLGFMYEVSEIERAIVAKVVQKCGNRLYWDEWAADIAAIAQTNISRITGILNKPENTNEIAAFDGFLKELKDDLNDSITRDEAIEMLAQHIITKPVFDALFENYSFTQNNPVSKAMQGVLAVLNAHNLDKEAATLEKFYASVKMRAQGIKDLKAKQKIIVELYDKFFKNAFPKMTERLGIVYTPVEVVDFIIHSVNDILKSEFNQTLGSQGVHIIDPFTGTGTFITRLLQSGLIAPEQLRHKYENEIHANEIVLLAYYIAAINIEQVYHDITGGDYAPFNGICLTDTFALYEKEDLVDALFTDNSSRRRKQKKLDIRVIMGNPPYSVGQKKENDDNQNVEYPSLDSSIRKSYAAHSQAASTKNLMDSYIRAIRWASDRIGSQGVVAFVSGSGFIEKPAMDGMRKCLVDDFSDIYILNLRGDIRKNMLSKGAAKEGQNIFGSSSMTGICISVLVKNLVAHHRGKISYFDIGDDLKTSEKIQLVAELRSIAGISKLNAWQTLAPDSHHDWLAKRNAGFSKYIILGSKKDAVAISIFDNYSLGLNTNRDSWVYNYSGKNVADNMKSTIAFYNEELARYRAACTGINRVNHPDPDTFASNDETKIKWSSSLRAEFNRQKKGHFSPHQISVALYRPFTKVQAYFDPMFNHRVGQLPRIYPNSIVSNLVICVSGIGARSGFSALIADVMPDLHTIDTGQCFPLKLYEPVPASSRAATPSTLFDVDAHANTDSAATLTPDGRYTVRDGITDAGLQHFIAAYGGAKITKEALFYYIYGLLHSPEYKARYADNLSKELPRIPCVRTYKDFQAFSTAGRQLAALHLGYETVTPYAVTFEGAAANKAELQKFDLADYRVTQMKFATKADKTRVVYNHKITIANIPLEAYDYIVNGKPALEWVMERQAITTHKDSGIINDANCWAIETMQDAAYPLKLFQRVITVSLETMKIVHALPKLELLE